VVAVNRAPGWLSVEQLARLTSPVRVAPKVGTRANGDVEVVWATDERSRSVSVTRLARRGDNWAVEDLFDLSSSARRGLALSFTPAGDLKVTWPASAVFGARALSSPAVVLVSGGRAHTIWAGVSRGTSGIFAAIVDAHAPSAGPAPTRAQFEPVPVASNGQGDAKSSPAIAVDERGNAQAVWIDRRDDVSAVYSAEQQPDGSWGRMRRVSNADKSVSGRPTIAIDGAGNAYAVWESAEDCGGPMPLEAVTFAERPAGGEWQPPVTLIAPGAGSHLIDPILVANDGGEVYAAWGESRDGAYRIYSTYRAAGGDWDSPRLAAHGVSDYPTLAISLAVNARGDAYLTWAETEGSQTTIRFAATN
jgi:hypothetical protein